MANPLGMAVITGTGKNLLVNALAGGDKVVPKFYRFSKETYIADSSMTSDDIETYWKEKGIDLYQVVTNDTIEFTMITEAIDAEYPVATVSMYLEDGTLFAVANPRYPIEALQRQIAKIQLSYEDMTQALDFVYLPFDETEQDLSLLNTIAVHGNQITKNTLKIEGIKLQGVS